MRYLTAARAFLADMDDENIGKPNLGKIQRHTRHRTRKTVWSADVFPREEIAKLIE